MAAYLAKFKELHEQSIDEQANFFSQRFVFSLGDNFSDVFDLAKEFKVACSFDTSGGGEHLSAAGAADFLQRHGKTRTALQRKAEVADIDLNNDGKISFIEYLMLHFKVMILQEHFERLGEEPAVDLSEDGVGVTNVGDFLVNELFQPPSSLDPDLNNMIAEFNELHVSRQAKIGQLEEKVAAGGVKGLAAKNELEQLKLEDQTDVNALEAKISMAIKRAQKQSKQELEKNLQAKEDAEKEKIAEGRSKMAERMAMFNK